MFALSSACPQPYPFPSLKPTHHHRISLGRNTQLGTTHLTVSSEFDVLFNQVFLTDFQPVVVNAQGLNCV